MRGVPRGMRRNRSTFRANIPAIAGSQKPSKDMAGADFAFTVATGRMQQDNQPVFGLRWYIPGVHSNIYCQIP